MPPQQPVSRLASIKGIVAKNPILVAVIVILIVGGVAYWLGSLAGYQVRTDEEALKEAAVKQTSEDVVKSTNPFQAKNPLEGVESNPLGKVKKVLNPFEN